MYNKRILPIIRPKPRKQIVFGALVLKSGDQANGISWRIERPGTLDCSLVPLSGLFVYPNARGESDACFAAVNGINQTRKQHTASAIIPFVQRAGAIAYDDLRGSGTFRPETGTMQTDPPYCAAAVRELRFPNGKSGKLKSSCSFQTKSFLTKNESRHTSA